MSPACSILNIDRAARMNELCEFRRGLRRILLAETGFILRDELDIEFFGAIFSAACGAAGASIGGRKFSFKDSGAESIGSSPAMNKNKNIPRPLRFAAGPLSRNP